MPLGYVYELVDTRNGECIYVGSTCGHPVYRWGTHIRDTFDKRERKSFIHKYMFDQGIEHFELRVIEEVFWNDKVDLLKREQLLIDKRKTRCNRNAAYVPGGQKSFINKAANNKYKRKRVVCECGSCVRQGGLACHRKTAKHARLLSLK